MYSYVDISALYSYDTNTLKGKKMKQLITIAALAFAGTVFAQAPAVAPAPAKAAPAPAKAASAPAKKEVKKVEKKASEPVKTGSASTSSK